MVRFLVDIQWDVSFLCEWVVFATFRSSVMSRKLMMVLFASTVIFKSVLRKILHRSF